MNNKQRLYNFNFNGFKKGKANKSRTHNLRSEQTLKTIYDQKVSLDEICDPDLIKKQSCFYREEKKQKPRRN